MKSNPILINLFWYSDNYKRYTFFFLYKKKWFKHLLICFTIQTKKFCYGSKINRWSSICFIIKIKKFHYTDPIFSNLFHNPSERNILIIKKKKITQHFAICFIIQTKKFCYRPKMKPACTQFHRSIFLKVNNINTFLCIITTGSVLFLPRLRDLFQFRWRRRTLPNRPNLIPIAFQNNNQAVFLKQVDASIFWYTRRCTYCQWNTLMTEVNTRKCEISRFCTRNCFIY